MILLLAQQCYIENCYYCSPNYFARCIACSEGFVLNPQREQCVSEAVGCVDLCSSCSEGACQACAYGYTKLYNGTCAACPEPDCLACELDESGAFVCTEWATPATEDYCENCALCDQQICLLCQPGYLFQERRCILCTDSSSGCAVCADGVTCSRCQQQYQLYNNYCYVCDALIPHCEQCRLHPSDVWLCNKCSDDYSPDFLGYSCGKCLYRVAHCLMCSVENPDLCGMCVLSYGYYLQDGYCERTDCYENYFSFNGTCRPCEYYIEGCTVCFNKTICSECAVSYKKTEAGGCGTCGNVSHCLVCKATDISYCAICDLDYHLLDGTCVSNACHEYCMSCADDGTCTECAAGYFARGQDCVLCSSELDGCKICTTDICTLCEDDRYLLQGLCRSKRENCLEYSKPKEQCLYCEKGYFRIYSVCEKCDSNCVACSSAYHCDKCSDGFLFTADGKCLNCTSDPYCEQCDESGYRCGFCKSFYILNENGNCSLAFCITGCAFCTEKHTCQQCYANYILEKGACMPDNCEVRDQDSICQLCKTGFSRNGNVCLKKSVKQTVIVASSIVGGSAIAAGVSIFVWKLAKGAKLKKEIIYAVKNRQLAEKVPERQEAEDIQQEEMIMRPPSIKKSFSYVLSDLQGKQ